MSRLLSNHTLVSAAQRFFSLLRRAGVRQTFSLAASVVDDQYLKCFDRRYHIRTSGYIRLHNTSFDPSRLGDATQYGPVNGWAFRRLLKELNLPRQFHFADLGCGLGRACIVAAEYGFEKVTGVELAADLCAGARANLAACRPPAGRLSPVEIVQQDALEFCARTDADVFFMYRPFSGEFLQRVLDQLAANAASRKKNLTIIYSERMAHAGSHRAAIAEHRAYREVRVAGAFGQAFYIYQCGDAPGVTGNSPRK